MSLRGALPKLTQCPKVIGGYAEAQANESRLGQLIRENVDAADIARQRGDVQLVLISVRHVTKLHPQL